ncbi:hypothetical protein PG985_003833 [Apiospora marii]|uniref:uncharacterized protein n=1 Tax=Apiospora marii TaxID=335849 RepID=UPI00312FBF23
MSSPTTFTRFEEFPNEIQSKIYEQAILEDHNAKVVPVVNSTKRVVLTQAMMRESPKFLGLSQVAYDVTKAIYDCPFLVVDRGIDRIVYFSSKLDIFLVSAWQYTLGVNINSRLLHQSINALKPTALLKIQHVMEHHLDLGDLVYSPVPEFDQFTYPSAQSLHIRVDHQRPTIASLAGQLNGPGPHTVADLLDYCTQPTRYEERAIIEEVTEEVDGGENE